MKTKVLFSAVSAAVLVLASCSKFAPANEAVQEPSRIIPDGCTEVVFAAGIEDGVKTALDETNDLQANWTGSEAINVWYRGEGGAATKVAATILSYSGKTAYISAAIPTAVADTATAYYAEMNGVLDASGKAPFGSGTKRARVKCPRVQNAVEGSFDPAAVAMGAKWTGAAGATPSFAFKQLNSLLKISIDNQSTKQIDSIVIASNDATIDSTYLVGTCYWDCDKGYLSVNGSSNTSRSICLKGAIAAGTAGDYYFATSVKNSKGFPRLKNMTITFYFPDGYYRKFTNSTNVNFTGYNQMIKLTGDKVLTLKDSELINNTYAPFGTAWSVASVKEANSTIQTAVGAVATMHAKSPNENVTATVKTSVKTVNTNGTCFYGMVDISFYVAESGTGTVTLSVKGQKSDTSKQKAEFYVNGELQASINPAYNVITEYTQDLTVKAGDLVRIYQNAGTSNPTLYVYYKDSTGSSHEHALTWTKKTE